METALVPPGQVTGTVQFYSQPEPLNPDQHAQLGFTRSQTPFDFARNAQAVPVQVTEFGPASLSFPIIFSGSYRVPLAIMGIRQDENLFVSADGRYDDDTYVPAFIRRYPFVLANNDDAEANLVVCIDRGSNAPLVEGGDVPLFKDGQPTEFTRQAIQFCQDFETERVRTDKFVARLMELDLFESKQATFTPRLEDGQQGPTMQLADYFAISEERVKALSPEVLAELVSTGALRQIDAHLNSMFNWERLLGRTVTRVNAANESAANTNA